MRVSPQLLLNNGYNFDIDNGNYFNHYYKSKVSINKKNIRVQVELKKIVSIIYFDVRHPFNKIESYIKSKHNEK